MKKIILIILSSIFVILFFVYVLLGIKLDKIAEENIKNDISQSSFAETSKKFNQLYWNYYTGTNKPKMDNKGVIQYIVYMLYVFYSKKNFRENNNSYLITDDAASILLKTNGEPKRYKYGWTITWYAVSRWISNKWSIEKCLNFLSNELYFGNGKYGLKDAAIFYCKKDPNSLSDEEIIKLIKITLSPTRNKDIFKTP